MEKLTRMSARYAKKVVNRKGVEYDFEYFGVVERSGIGSITMRAHVLTNATEKILLTSRQLEGEEYEITETSYTPLLNEFWEAAYDAHRNISWVPDDRQEDTIKMYEKELLNDIANMPERDVEGYVAKYKQHFGAWLSAQSRCTSSMITGGANYNVRRHNRAVSSEESTRGAFYEWRDKAINAINKRAERERLESMTEEERARENVKPLLREILDTFEHPHTWKKALCYGKLERVALKGGVKEMEEVLRYIEELGEEKKQIFTPRHKVWNLVELAKGAAELKEDKAAKGNTEREYPWGSIINNVELDRVQFIFSSRPDRAVIDVMKKHAFRWSPSNKAWQRKLTDNALFVVDQYVIKELGAVLEGEAAI